MGKKIWILVLAAFLIGGCAPQPTPAGGGSGSGSGGTSTSNSSSTNNSSSSNGGGSVSGVRIPGKDIGIIKPRGSVEVINAQDKIRDKTPMLPPGGVYATPDA